MYLSLKNRLNKIELVARNIILAYSLLSSFWRISLKQQQTIHLKMLSEFFVVNLLIYVIAGISPDSVDEVLAIGAV